MEESTALFLCRSRGDATDSHRVCAEANAEKRGGQGSAGVHCDVQDPRAELTEQLLDVDETLDALANEDPIAAELVKLRLFAGLSITDAGLTLGLSRSTAYENWKFARRMVRRAWTWHGPSGR